MGDEHGSFKEEPLPASMKQATEAAHNELVEKLSEVDDTFGDWFLEGNATEMNAPSNILQAIRRVLIRLSEACRSRVGGAHQRDFSLVPVFCGSSLKNKGVGASNTLNRRSSNCSTAWTPCCPRRLKWVFPIYTST